MSDAKVMRPRFPVVDAHNHLWGDWNMARRTLDVMDKVGIAAYCDLTANVSIAWKDGGYRIKPRSIDDFFTQCVKPYPGRFYGFTTATFAVDPGEPLFTDAGEFVTTTVDTLKGHFNKGARGLKILKELGLRYVDGDGNLIGIDDARLAPIWEECAGLAMPVLMHQSDPSWFFEPVTPENEHYESLMKYPDWSFADLRFPRKADLIRRRDNVVRNHPRTTFILPHVANFAEDLDYVSGLLDANANVHIDFSARIDELGRKPDDARAFLIEHQDRVLFGTDMPASPEMYQCYFRFLETHDKGLIPPDYDGTFGRFRWHIQGLGLPDTVLKKIYHENALRLIPGLKDDLRNITGAAT